MFEDLNFEPLVSMWKLWFATKQLEGEIPTYFFETNFELSQYVLKEIEDKKDTVFLIDFDDEIFISDTPKLVFLFLNSMFGMIKQESRKEVFLFEFNSYEEAYIVALDMKETNPLCFEPKEEDIVGSSSDN